MSTDLKSAASAILTAYLRTTPMDADAVGPLLADIIRALSKAIEPARPILTLSEPTGPNGRRRRIKAEMAAISANAPTKPARKPKFVQQDLFPDSP